MKLSSNYFLICLGLLAVTSGCMEKYGVGVGNIVGGAILLLICWLRWRHEP
jgi:hypothetical protein